MATLNTLLRPRQFLFLVGTVLVLLGSGGITGFLSSISSASLFNPPYWINWVHLAFGFVVLAIAAVGGTTLQNAMTLAAGVMGGTLGLSGLLVGSYAADRWSMPELADPAEHVAHLIVGVLGLWAWSNRKARSEQTGVVLR